jgi:hypothetical protein
VTYSRDVYEHDRAMAPNRCQHRLLSVVPIVSVRIEGGYAARYCQMLWIGPDHAATFSSFLSTNSPFKNLAPALTRGTSR